MKIDPCIKCGPQLWPWDRPKRRAGENFYHCPKCEMREWLERRRDTEEYFAVSWNRTNRRAK